VLTTNAWPRKEVAGWQGHPHLHSLDPDKKKRKTDRQTDGRGAPEKSSFKRSFNLKHPC